MRLFDRIFGHPAIRKLSSQQKQDVNRLLDELVKIGKLDDFLSLHPGGQFNIQCHHIRAKQIGRRLNEIGGLPLMEAARAHVKRKLKAVMAEHLDYCWQGIGEWQP